MKYLIDIIAHFKPYLKGGFAILSLTFLFYLLDIDIIINMLKKVDKGLLSVSIILILFRHGLQSFRFYVILRMSNKLIHIRDIALHYFIGYYYNFFLPSSIGGDVARVLLMERESISKSESSLLIFYERFFGFFSLSFISGLAIPFLTLEHTFVYAILSLIVSFVFGTVILLKVVKHSDHKFLKRVKIVLEKTSFRSFSIIFILSLVFQLFSIVVRYLLALSFGIQVPIIYFFLLIPLINVVTMLPISFNGVGTREASFIYLFGMFGVVKEESFVLSLTSYVMLIFLAVIGGMLNLKQSLKFKNAKTNS